ncbi:MAG: hypothetical protein EXR81_06870 [Gammaproteobacteria bacterium]|nr:hypothetical protein [Gammaproteobacteria bacterium]
MIITRHADKTIHSLQEYVLIEQDFVDVDVCRRVNGWISEHYFLGDEVTFTSAVTDIYARVNNEDMSDYLQQLANEQGVIP